MKKLIYLFIALAVCGALSVLLINRTAPSDKMQVGVPDYLLKLEAEQRKNKEPKSPIFTDLLHAMRANPATGKVDQNEVIAAKRAVLEMSRTGRGALSLEWEEMGPDNIGGRTRGILIDRDNPSRMYAGGVTGGLWISSDAGLNWTVYNNDTLGGIGVVSFTQAANGDIYLGTGELYATLSGIGRDDGTTGLLGEGIWKSTDGVTFHHLKATQPAPNSSGTRFAFINAMAAHPTNPNIVYAATNNGIEKTEDGGVTWQKLVSGGPVASGDVDDIHVGKDGLVYAGIEGRYYRSQSAANPDNMVQGTTLGTFPNAQVIRLRIAIAPSDPNYIYVMGCDGAGRTSLVARSTDAGANFASIAPTLPSPHFNPTGNQGWYDMEIAVNPGDKNIAYVGGQINVWRWMDNSWAPISTTFGFPGNNPTYVHADHHEIMFHPNNPDIMYIGTDGGVFRSLNPRAAQPSFQDMNKGYITTQFYSVSAGINGSVLGGTQDNGNIYIDFTGNTERSGAGIYGGDGGFTDISKTQPNIMFTTTVTSVTGSQDSRLARSSNFGSSFNNFLDTWIDNDQNGVPDCGTQFVNPIRLWENTDPNDTSFGEGRLLVGTDCGLWLGSDVLNAATIPAFFHIATPNNGFSGVISYIEWSKDGEHAYVGTTQGLVYRFSGLRNNNYVYTDTLSTPTPEPFDDVFVDQANITQTVIADFSGRFVTEIAVDKNNPEHVVVTLGNYGQTNYVYRSQNAASTSGTGTFTPIQGNLPRMPVYAAEISYYNPSHIVVGTEMGIFSTSNNGISWSYDSKNLPLTGVFELRQEEIDTINKGCYVLYAGTYGRGIFRTTTLIDPTIGCDTEIYLASNERYSSDLKDVVVYPNPVSDVATVKINMPRASDATITVYDLFGRRVYEKNLGRLSAGIHSPTIDVSRFRSGNYLVVIRTDSGEQVKKVLVH